LAIGQGLRHGSLAQLYTTTATKTALGSQSVQISLIYDVFRCAMLLLPLPFERAFNFESFMFIRFEQISPGFATDPLKVSTPESVMREMVVSSGDPSEEIISLNISDSTQEDAMEIMQTFPPRGPNRKLMREVVLPPITTLVSGCFLSTAFHPVGMLMTKSRKRWTLS
jgi:hypothetical protein